MSSSKAYWPELYGFSIYGNGPSFVIYVEPESVAEAGGLRSGDRIVELDEQNVSNLSAGVIKFMARNSKRNPPAISVQSASTEIEIMPSKKLNSYGFTVIGDLPVFVESIDERGSAYAAGLRQGDVILEVNGRRVRYTETVQPIIETVSSGKLKLKYLKILGSLGKNKGRSEEAARSANESGWNEEKVERARRFYSVLNDVFGNESEKRKIVLDELKLYTKTSDVYKLATNLNKVLRTTEQRQLIDYILPFIPQRHQGRLKTLMTIDLTDNGRRNNSSMKQKHAKTTVSSSISYPDAYYDEEKPQQQRTEIIKNGGYDGILYDYSASSKIHCDSAAQTDHVPPPPTSATELTTTVTYSRARTPVQKIETRECYSVPFSCNKRTITVIRDTGDKFGFTLRGQRPIVAEAVDKDSPADFANMLPNDVILSVDGIDVEEKSHRFLIELLKTTGRRTVFEVMQKPEYDLYALSKAQKSVTNDMHEAYYPNSDILECRNSEGKTFKEKINDILNSHEKFKLKKYILDYNSTKNIWEFVSRTNELLDTPAKQGLWFFLSQMLDEHHKDYVKNIIDFNYEIGGPKKSTSISNLLFDAPAHKSRDQEKNQYSLKDQAARNYHHSPHLSQKLKKMKEFASAPSLLELDNENKANESDLVFQFAKQLDYLLNFDEKNNIKFALKKYDEDRDIHSFTCQVDNILDTPAKRTLWFHLIPLLDEDDQEYCKRKLCLPIASTSAAAGVTTRKHHLQSSGNTLCGASAGTLSAMPYCKSAIRSYYYKTDENYSEKKNFYDDDFVLTDHEIDNLFDLPENQDISSSRMNSPNRWPKSDDEEEEEINFYKRSRNQQRKDLSTEAANRGLARDRNKWKTSASEVWNQNRRRYKHLFYAETKTIDLEQVEPFMPLINASALYEQNCEDYEIKIQIESNLNISLSSSSSLSSLYSITEELALQKNEAIKFQSEISPIKKNIQVRNEKTSTPRLLTTGAQLELMQSKSDSNFYMTKDEKREEKEVEAATAAVEVDESAMTAVSIPSELTEITNEYKNEKFFDYQKSVLELLVDDERLGKRFQNKESLNSSNSEAVTTEQHQQQQRQKIQKEDSITVPKLKLNDEKTAETPKIIAVSNSNDNDTDDVIVKQKSSLLTKPKPPAPPPLPVNLLNVKNNLNSSSNSNNVNSLAVNSNGKNENNFKANSLKRINWEKIDNKNLSGTLWEKLLPNENLSQVINYLDIDTMFARKKSQTTNVMKQNAAKPNEVRVLNTRKAYNIAIVLASLKNSWNDLLSCLYGNMDDTNSVITPQLVKHILKYYPDEEEFRLYKAIDSVERLSIPDRFMYQLCMIPNSDFRLKSLVFKSDFNERVFELNQNLDVIKQAIDQVKESVKLKNMIELILVLGNYLNQGNERLSKASAFKLNVLPQLDQIKLTSNGAYSLMNLLAKLAYEQFPETIDIKKELNSIEPASKVSFKSILQEISDLQMNYQTIKTSIDNLKPQDSIAIDNFNDYMNKFLESALFSLDPVVKKQQEIQTQFIELVKYFGEDIETTNLDNFFLTLNQFIQKFENAHKRNILMLYSPLKIKKTTQ